MPYSLIVDIVVAVLLVITIIYAISLNKRLGLIRRDRGELEKLAQKFAASTERANESLGQLQSTAEILQRQIDSAHALHDDLAFLLERGEKAADRLEDTIRRSRGLSDDSATVSDNGESDQMAHKTARNLTKQGQKNSPKKQSRQNSTGEINGTAGNSSGAEVDYTPSDAERDLLKAIRSSS